MLNTIYDLRTQVFDGLELKAEIVEQQGQFINVGEQFKVKFTVTHRLYDPITGWFSGNVRFAGCNLALEATPYAKPVTGTPMSYLLGDLTYVGQYSAQIVEFTALNKIPTTRVGVNKPEPYVKARVYARFDIAAFFDFWQEKTFWTQIEAT